MTNCNEEPTILPDLKKVMTNRQEFLKLLSLALGGFIAMVASIPGLAFIFNFLFTPTTKEWIKVGALDKFAEGETVEVFFIDPSILPWDGVSGHRSAWLRRVSGEDFIAFAVNCTHLGCPVRWETGAQLFMCPCHGGVYDQNGNVEAGPPPRPLSRFPVRIAQGQVEIQVRPVMTEG